MSVVPVPLHPPELPELPPDVQLAAELADALAELDNARPSVATYLKRLDYVGCLSKSGYCPVARFLADRLRCNVAVCSVFAFASRDGWQAEVNVPRSVSSFVNSFDRGYIPGLIDPECAPHHGH